MREQWILLFGILASVLSALAMMLAWLTYSLVRRSLGGLPVADTRDILTILLGIRNHVASGFQANHYDLEFIIRSMNRMEGFKYEDLQRKPKRRWLWLVKR